MPPLEERETPIVDEDNDGLAPLERRGCHIVPREIIESISGSLSSIVP
jgi:hypothetical protein